MTQLPLMEIATGLGALSVILLLAVLLRLRQPVRDDEQHDLLVGLDAGQVRMERSVKEEVAMLRHETAAAAKLGRDEQRETLKMFGDSIETRLETVRQTVEARLKAISEDNSAKLEKIRGTVEEKLHDTLEQRLGRSFKLVTDQLEKVSEGLGEMRALASNVGDLKKVMINVSQRGAWGEIRLEALLEDSLTRDQYERNVAVKEDSNDRVEFAIKLPGTTDEGPVLLPIDAKFPTEDYQRLLDAQDEADKAAIAEAGKALETRIKGEAKKINEKYIDPPNTTDFAIMFLPTEGLYSEVMRRPGLADLLRQEYRVTVTGPTTLSALLNSLRMGFQTLALQKRSSEVWRTLRDVKAEVMKFGEKLDRTRKKIKEAGDSIDDVETRTRAIDRKLRNVEKLPSGDEEEENGER